MSLVLRAVLIGLAALSVCSQAASQTKIAIVIDDMGNSRNDAAVFDLPIPLTVAILPHTPWANRFANQAQRNHIEVMLHLPMQALGEQPLGPGAMTSLMTLAERKATLDEALLSLPMAKGVNNHMGSQLTAERDTMAWLMAELKQRDLYFLDSRTTVDTQAERQALQQGLATGRRHVFLDPSRDETVLQAQFDALIALAKKQREIVVIGHPYAETLALLNQRLPELKAMDVEFVYASELMHRPQANSSLVPTALK